MKISHARHSQLLTVYYDVIHCVFTCQHPDDGTKVAKASFTPVIFGVTANPLQQHPEEENDDSHHTYQLEDEGHDRQDPTDCQPGCKQNNTIIIVHNYIGLHSIFLATF